MFKFYEKLLLQNSEVSSTFVRILILKTLIHFEKFSDGKDLL